MSKLLALPLAGLLLFAWNAAADSLERGFAVPPDSTRPWCYWYWISDNISREGITRDLEAMKRVGIGEALIGNIYLDDVKTGSVKALTPEWWGMIEHAIREGGRLGVDIGLFNCPGWSQSGGPWIKPEQSMRYLAQAEHRVSGPARFVQKLPVPAEPFQPVAVLAFPVPAGENETLASRKPQLASTPSAEGLDRLVDARPETVFEFPRGARGAGKSFVIDIQLAQPITARSLTLTPGPSGFAFQAELQVEEDGKGYRTVRQFPVDRSNLNKSVGFLPHAPVVISLDSVQGRNFRLICTKAQGDPALAEIDLSPAARLERAAEKQLAKMHPTPLPMWDTYMWPTPPEPGGSQYTVAPGQIVDLTSRLQPDGSLAWDVPAGDWIILLTGMTPTGMKNAPASPEGQGLEVDKMNRAAARAHFDAYIGEVLRRLPARDRKAFKHVVADSYEMGSENWTDGFRELFQTTYGYDPRPWLAVLTGRVVGSADQSERFLWDLRRLVADRVAYDYVGGLREASREHGLRLWLENYGHWGFPGEFLKYGGQSDDVSGEFWATGDLGSIELRAAASAAHTYGKNRVSAEAFTSTLKFESTPWSIKKRGDWAVSEGINHWVLHVYIHQPWEQDRLPGVNAWFSTEFNRHNTWFEQGKAWIDYYRRSHFLLQQGRHVADIAYFIGEDAPKMTGVRNPPLPAGYDFDYINAEVILDRLSVRDGRWALPDGKSYRVLVLPEQPTIRPEVLRKVRDLVKAGGIVVGNPPLRSPSLQNYPQADAEVQNLARELWGENPARRAFGKGQVFPFGPLAPVLTELGLAPDVGTIDPRQILWTHRQDGDTDLYFISNQTEKQVQVAPAFRVDQRAPEIWNPVSAGMTRAAVYERANQLTRVALDLAPRESLFVVFRDRDRSSGTIVQARWGSTVLSNARQPFKAPSAGKSEETPNTFSMAAWVRPAMGIGLPKQQANGVANNYERNELVTPTHGDSAFPGGGNVVAGLSVGTNGLVVYEHGANHYAPVLVYSGPFMDWTHFAVVYQDGTPQLFVNGKLVATGVKSGLNVYSGVAVEPSGSGAFRGGQNALQNFSSALGAAELKELIRSTRPPEEAVRGVAPELALDRKGALVVSAPSPGQLHLTYSDGRQRSVSVAGAHAPQTIAGPWNVTVGEQTLQLDQLSLLNDHPSEAVRYFAGTAVYRTSLNLVQPTGNERVTLDLGRVEPLAEVVLNSKSLGVQWAPPYSVDLTRHLKPGRNELEVRVTGTWRNRLIGHAKYPNGLPGAKEKNLPYLTADLKIKPTEGLAPFGLVGPVKLVFTRETVVNKD